MPRRALPPVAVQASSFARQREADRASLAEDYVELIDDLLREEGEARATDLARRFGVSQATVTATLARLQRAGLVETKPYRGLFLTTEGHRLAAAARTRHQLLVRFLLALGVDAETAAADAEGLEHHVSTATLEALARWVRAQEEAGR